MPAKHELATKRFEALNDLLRTSGLVLRAGTAVDVTLIAVPGSMKNQNVERDHELNQFKKRNQC